MSETSGIKLTISMHIEREVSKGGFKTLTTKTTIMDRVETLISHYKDDPLKALGATDNRSLKEALAWWTVVIRRWALLSICTREDLKRLFEQAVLNLQKKVS
jgi:hypothetical protein